MSELDEPGTLTRRDHGDTSHDAAAKALGRSGSARRKVLTLLYWASLTDEEQSEALRMPPNSQRPRRVELVQLGYVEDSGERRANAYGNACVVWRITQEGREALS